MTALNEIVLAVMSGGGGTLALQAGIGWAKSVRGDKEIGAKVAQQRDALTIELLDAARTEMSAVREELSELHVARLHAVHIEEALDHLHELLRAEGDEETKAARRRARAFLKRMRPDIGDLRNRVQVNESAHNIAPILNPRDDQP